MSSSSSSNPVGIAINVEDDDVKLAKNHNVTPLIVAIFCAQVSNILLLSLAAICGVMETLCRSWTYYFSPAVFGAEAEMLHRSTLGFIITALIGFAEIKSQGQTGFPFQTHHQAIMVSVTTLLVYGLASAAEHVFSVDPSSIYAIVARLGCFALLSFVLICNIFAKSREPKKGRN